MLCLNGLGLICQNKPCILGTLSLKRIIIWTAYMHNYSICRASLTALKINKLINTEIPIFLCLNWNEILYSWKVYILYILRLGLDVTYVSIGDIRLFSSSTKILQDLLYYHNFIISYAPSSLNVISKYPIGCLAGSNLQIWNIDLLLSGLQNSNLVILKTTVKSVVMMNIAPRLWDTSFSLLFVCSWRERIINLIKTKCYFSMLACLR
ncbi:MAG: hypothetical protein ACKESC_01540 [Candidatus Hodgkinia cicadicola]